MWDQQQQVKQEGIKERNLKLLNTGLHSDCVFLVGNEKKTFKAHKLILSAASPVFEKMFFAEFKSDIIEICDTSPTTFDAVLRYIYSDQTTLDNVSKACDVCYLAEKYMMPHLAEICFEFIQKKFDASNVCQVYEFAVLLNRPLLVNASKEIILTRTGPMLNHSSFENIQKKTIHMILDQDNLNINSELLLYNAAIRWVKAEIIRNDIKDENEMQMLYDEVLTKIRYMCMKPKEFAEGPAVDGYISEADALAIFVNICSTTNPKKEFPAKYQIGKWNSYRSSKTYDLKCDQGVLGMIKNQY